MSSAFPRSVDFVNEIIVVSNMNSKHPKVICRRNLSNNKLEGNQDSNRCPQNLSNYHSISTTPVEQRVPPKTDDKHLAILQVEILG